MQELCTVLFATAFALLWLGPDAMSEGTPQPDIALAMIALREPSFPDKDPLIAYIKKTWPDAESFGSAEPGDDMIFFAGEGTEVAFISLMPAAIPWGDLEYPCATAYGWPKACEELRKSKAHIIVSVAGGDSDAVERHMRTTMLVQAAAHFTKPVGIYWGNAASVWKMDAFEKSAITMSREDPPFPLWFGLKIEAHEDKTRSVFTVGLEHFGVMNVEVQRSKRPVLEVHELVGDIAIYLIKNGPVINDGETVGHTADQKIKVSVGSSIYDPSVKAYRLEF
jgi:hypothetical protein